MSDVDAKTAYELAPGQPSPIVQFFAFEHLPPSLQSVSKPLGELARTFDAMLPTGAEKTAGLRKLLEAKDCFVRAALTTRQP